MLYFLKILTTLITTFLAILAVTTDFTDKDKNLKPAGKWYIGIFLLSVALNVLFDNLSDQEKDQKTRDNLQNTVLAIKDSTDKLLNKTKDSLNVKFKQITNISNQIDTHLINTKRDIGNQLSQTNASEKSIRALSERIKATGDENVTRLGTAIGSLKGLTTDQTTNFSMLDNIGKQSKNNLESIQNVFGDVKTLTEPLAPLQFIIQIKYKLDKPIMLFSKYKTITLFKAGDAPYQNAQIITPKESFQNFINSFECWVNFRSDSSLQTNEVTYDFNDPKTLSIEYSSIDTTLIRTVSVNFNSVIDNPHNLNTISELFEKATVQITSDQGLWPVPLIQYTQKENGKSVKIKQSMNIVSSIIIPSIALRTSNNYSRPYLINQIVQLQHPDRKSPILQLKLKKQ